jgi:4-hydroxybenzoate polyprenyltransferase
MARALVGLLIAYVVLSFVYGMLTTPETGNALMALALLLGILFFLWTMLPDWFKRLVRRTLGKGGRHEDR